MQHGCSTVIYLGSKLLETPNVDGTLLRGIEVATTHTQVTGRTHHSTRQPQGVVGEDGLGSTIVVLTDKVVKHIAFLIAAEKL